MRRFLAVSLLLAACGEPDPPAVPPDPQRIVSLLPAWTEVLCKLRAADRLVGCTEYCRPGREMPHVAWESTLAAEGILRLRPDLVLRQTRRRGEDALQQTLEAAGVPVLSLPSETIEDIRGAIRRIGAAVGLGREAKAYVQRFDGALARACAGAEGRGTPSVLFVIRRDAGKAANISAAGPGTFLDELIRLAGGRNVLAGFDAPYPTVRLEQVVRLKPQVIIDNLAPEEDPLTAWEDLAEAGVPAVVNLRVHRVRDNSLLIPGPRLPEAVARLVAMIHGDS